MSGDFDDDDVAQIRLKSIVFTKYKLDPSYSRGKEVGAKEAGWSCGVNWDIDTTGVEWNELRIHILLNLYRKKDNFSIVRLNTTTAYYVSKGHSFNMKYSILIDLCNQVMAQTQGIWRVKVQNPCLSRLVMQSHDLVLSMETDFKRLIYELWE